jgi:hypothetical protein
MRQLGSVDVEWLFVGCAKTTRSYRNLLDAKSISSVSHRFVLKGTWPRGGLDRALH